MASELQGVLAKALDPEIAKQWVRDHAADTIEVLTEEGVVAPFSDCGLCTGRDYCLYPEDEEPECVPVFSLVLPEENDG